MSLYMYKVFRNLSLKYFILLLKDGIKYYLDFFYNYVPPPITNTYTKTPIKMCVFKRFTVDWRRK